MKRVPIDDLAQNSWFPTTRTSFQQFVVRTGRMRTFVAGERLLSRGDNSSGGLYCLLSGLVRVSCTGSLGEESVIAWGRPFEWFGELSLLDGLPVTQDVTADVDSEILFVPAEAVEDIAKSDPLIWHDLARLACWKLRLALVAIEGLASMPISGRLARSLVLLAERDAAPQGMPNAKIQISQEHLASMAAASRQSCNRALKRFENDGIVVLRYGFVEIVDGAALREVAGLS